MRRRREVRTGNCAAMAVALVLAFAPTAAPAQDARFAAAVDSLFAPWATDSTPGCAVAVRLAGRILHVGAYGMADLERRSPITPGTVFGAASLAKPFTAAAVALLIQEGRLRPDDDVRRWVPELPDYGAPITVADLIHHTSGVRDYLSLWDLADRDPEDRMRPSDVLHVLARQRALNFDPGTAHLYSNSGYFLLELIVERETGSSLAEYAAARLFRPLGMERTLYPVEAGRLILDRAESYRQSDQGLERAVLRSLLLGAGGLYTTVEDLLRWDAALDDGTLDSLSPGLGDRLHTRGRLRDGSEVPYAYGLQLFSYRSAATVTHGGTWGGYRSYYLRIPDHAFAAAVMCNQMEISPFQLTRRLADLALGGRLSLAEEPPLAAAAPPASPAARRDVTPDRPAEYAGDFWSEELEVVYTVQTDSGRLAYRRGRSNPAPLTVAHPDTLIDNGTSWAIRRNGAGEVTGFQLSRDRARGIVFHRVRTAGPERMVHEPPVQLGYLPSDTLRIPAGDGRSVLVDGQLFPDEWDDAAAITVGDSVRLRLKQNRGYVFLGIEAPFSMLPYVDLFLELQNGTKYNLHASSQLGERMLPDPTWTDTEPPTRWGFTDRWTANELRQDRVAAERLREEDPQRERDRLLLDTTYPYDGFEFQLQRARFDGSTWRLRVEIRSVVAQGRQVVFPVESEPMRSETWAVLRFDEG